MNTVVMVTQRAFPRPLLRSFSSSSLVLWTPPSEVGDRRNVEQPTVRRGDSSRGCVSTSSSSGRHRQAFQRRRRSLPATCVRRRWALTLCRCDPTVSGRRCTGQRPRRAPVPVSGRSRVVCPRHGSYCRPTTAGPPLPRPAACPRRAPCSGASSFYHRCRRRRGRLDGRKSASPKPGRGCLSTCVCRRRAGAHCGGGGRPSRAPRCAASAADRAWLNERRRRRVDGSWRLQRRAVEPQSHVDISMTSSSPWRRPVELPELLPTTIQC